MFLETVRSEGLAQHSYIGGDGGEAFVIDPRRDYHVYLDIAYRNGAKITHIFETHRNEDFTVGSCELAQKTGAVIHHGAELPFAFGKTVSEGDVFEMGDVRLTVLKTPGHTDESISIALADTGFGDDAVAVFTGDALFVGDVGRTDFYPDRAEEVAGLLYDSLHEKLLPLGDQVILYPAHGAGSVCGSGMASREFSTLGVERRYNPALQLDRAAFIRRKVGEHHYQPPYFRQMEKYNLEGPPDIGTLPMPPPYDPEGFHKLIEDGIQVIDVRSPEAFAGAYIPGSLAMPLNMVPGFAGWFLDYDRPIGLVVNDFDQVKTVVRHLIRLGYDKFAGFLDGGLAAWETGGKRYDRIPAIYAGDLKKRLADKEDFTLLDVRQIDEFEAGHLEGAVHIYLGELPDNIGKIPGKRPVTTFCGSGRRAIIAASILKKNGFSDVEDCLGSMEACKEIGCRIIDEKK